MSLHDESPHSLFSPLPPPLPSGLGVALVHERKEMVLHRSRRHSAIQNLDILPPTANMTHQI